MRKIKVLYVAHSAYVGGGEIALLTLLTHLDKTCFEPVLIFPAKGPVFEKSENLGFRNYIVPLEWWIRPPNYSWLEGNDISSRLLQIIGIIETEKPDVIHSNTSVVLEGALAAKLKRIPHVWHVHEKLENHPTLKTLIPLSSVYRIMDFLSDKIVTVSNGLRMKLLNHIKAEKVVTVFNGISSSVSSVTDAIGTGTSRCPSDGICAISVGALIKEKGFDDLLKSAALVKKTRPDIKFLIAGGGAPEAINDLNKMIKTLDLRETVFYLGFCDDVRRLLRECNFLILPSLSDAFPLVVLEAMAAGKPVIATNCGGPSEMIIDAESGFIVPVNDPTRLCEKILEISSDRNRMLQMGRKAYERFEEEFTAVSYANNFENLYRGILQGEKQTDSTRQLDSSLLFDEFIKSFQVIFDNNRLLEKSIRQLKEKETELEVAGHDIEAKDKDSKEKSIERQRLEEELMQKEATIEYFLNSKSWKITAPLRTFYGLFKKNR